MTDPLLDDLLDWLRIPSISTGGGDPADLQRAAEWAADARPRRRRHGGARDDRRRQPARRRRPGRVRRRTRRPSSSTGTTTSRAPATCPLWSSDPFVPEIRDGRLYARGASDDKGNFLPLLHVACALARDGALPVNVRVLIEGEEEAASHAVAQWIRADERRADCAIVFDSDMADADTPAVTLGLRGIVMTNVDVRVAPRDLHSGRLRRHGRQRAARPARHARRGRAGAGRPRARGAARGHRAARSRRARVLGAPAPGRRRARRRWAPTPSGTRRTSTCGRAPTRRSTSTRSAAASRARSCPRRRTRRSHCASPRGRIPTAWPRCSAACCATPRRRTPRWRSRPSAPRRRSSTRRMRASRWRPRRSSGRSAWRRC